MAKKKEWYLEGEYSKTEFDDILERTRKLLVSIMRDYDISFKSFKRLTRIRRMLIEFESVGIKEVD